MFTRSANMEQWQIEGYRSWDSWADDRDDRLEAAARDTSEWVDNYRSGQAAGLSPEESETYANGKERHTYGKR
ncbi:MAG TPA: hypothetical protein VF575_00620 [Candidatus Saccharimonadales bacterium]